MVSPRNPVSHRGTREPPRATGLRQSGDEASERRDEAIPAPPAAGNGAQREAADRSPDATVFAGRSTKVRRAIRLVALVSFHLFVVRPVLRFFGGVRFRRRDLVPDGTCLVVANHNSHLDAPVLLSLFPLRRLPKVHPVAAADYFGETWLRRTMAMVLMNAVPIHRAPGAGQDPLAHLMRALREGESLILFPEGTRGEAGVVAPFRAGVGRIVRGVPDVPVVPVFLHGPERIWPRGELVPVPLGIDVRVGKPRTYDASKEPREIAEEVRRDVLALALPAATLPGPKPAAPVFVAVSGGDAGARAAVAARLAERLGSLGTPQPVVPLRRWHTGVAKLLGVPAPHEGRRFAELTRRARAEQALCRHAGGPFVVTDGCALVDLLASSRPGGEQPASEDHDAYTRLLFAESQRRIPLLHWWRLAREDPAVFLLNALSLARMRAPRVLVLLSASEGERRVAELLRRTRGTEVCVEAPDPESDPAWLAAIEQACRRLAEPAPAPERPARG